MTSSGTTSGKTSNSEWQLVFISANFPFSRLREEPTNKHSKGKSWNLKEDLEEQLLN